jgi:hypothetical protein
MNEFNQQKEMGRAWVEIDAILEKKLQIYEDV